MKSVDTTCFFDCLKNSKYTLFMCFIFLYFCFANQVSADLIVHNSNFDTSQGATYTSNGEIGTSDWFVSRSGDDWGARIHNNQLELTNDSGAAGNVNGWVFAYRNPSNFIEYNPTLKNNSGLLTWYFNMQQIRPDPVGFTAGSYGAAFILGASSTSANNTGNGYAVVLGQGGAIDAVRLARYNNGLAGTLTDIIASNTAGCTDFGAEYISIKVTYNPLNDMWELFIRNDGTSEFSNPAIGTLVSQGSAIDNVYVNTNLNSMGGWWQGSTVANQTAFFDNVTVIVGPSIDITFPTNNYDTYISVISVNGTTKCSVTGNTVVIRVNDVTIDTYTLLSDSGSWNFENVNLNAGVNNINVQHISGGAAVAQDTIQVNYFNEMPSIGINYPTITSHDTYFRTITVSGTTAATYLGDSIYIYTNGILNRIITLSSSNQDWSGTAALTGISDSVSVYIYDRFGRFACDTKTINFFDTPSIEITYPSYTSHDTNLSIITISGTTNKTFTGDSINIYVNGVISYQSSVISQNGEWSGTAALTGFADSVVVRLQDRFGRLYYDTITVNYFSQPAISITNVSTGHDTYFRTITVSGTTTATYTGDTVQIYVNSIYNSQFTINNLNGSFNGTALLIGVGDSVAVYLHDRFGRIVYDTKTINFFDTPSLEITYPSYTSHDTSALIITVSGTTNKTFAGDSINIYVNGVISYQSSVISQNGDWSGTAALTGMADSVVVRLRDKFGRLYYDTITVNRYTSGWGTVSLTSPASANVTDTITAEITISTTRAGAFMDSIVIELPANFSWSGNSGDVSLSGTGFPGGELITVSGTGGANDSYIITIHNSSIKSGDNGVVSIANINCNGGSDYLFGNGIFRFIIKTAAENNAPANISSQPTLTVGIGAGKLLISEVCHSYNNTTDDVFVEIYNPLNCKLNIHDLYLKNSAYNNDPGVDGSGGTQLRRVGNGAIIKGRGYYLFGGPSYSGTVSADTTITSIAAAGGHVFLVYNNTLLDKFGWGSAAFPEGTVFGNTPASGENATMERKAQITSTASSMMTGADQYRGNGYDSNNNNNDFIKRIGRDPQNSNSPSEPAVSGGLVVMSPAIKVARSGKGTFQINFVCGINEISGSVLEIGIPGGWTTPQKTVAANAGYTTVSITNGTLGSWDITSNTIAINITTLNAEQGVITIYYGDTSNGANMTAIAEVQNTIGSGILFPCYLDGAENPGGSPTVDVVNIDAITFDPSVDPTSFIGSNYPLKAYPKSGGNLVFGAPVNFSFSGNGTDSYISEISGYTYAAGGSNINRTCYSGYDGAAAVQFKITNDSKLNTVKATETISSIENYFYDNPRLPIPVISEISWVADDEHEYIELYNPTDAPINMGTTGIDPQSYHIGKFSSKSSVADTVNFNGVTIPAYGYVLIYDAAPNSGNYPPIQNPYYYATPDIIRVLNIDFSASAGGEFLADGDLIGVYRDVNFVDEFVDAHDYGATQTWFGYTNLSGGRATAATERIATERKWISRSGAIESSWYYSAQTHFFNGGQDAGKGSPGSANSRSLYNSTISLSSQADSITNRIDSIPIVVKLELNIGHPVRYHYVGIGSSKSSDTLYHWYNGVDSYYTNAGGYCTVYIRSSVSGISTITIDTPLGVFTAEDGSTKKSIEILFDFDSPVISNISNTDMWDTSLTNNMTVTVTAVDALTGVAPNYPKIRFSWDTGVTWTNFGIMSNTGGNNYSYDTNFVWVNYSGETLYYQVVCQDKVGNETGAIYTEYINQAPPLTIGITYPSNNHDTGTQIITVSGTSNNSNAGDTIQIYVNEVISYQLSVISQNGDWSGTAALTGYADSVVVKIIDLYGRTAYDTITINYFPPPSVKIIIPDTISYDTNIQIITVSGTTMHSNIGAQLEFFVNTTLNTTIIISAVGADFECTVSLTAIGDSVWAKLTALGGTAYDTITVNYDTIAPAIPIGIIATAELGAGDTGVLLKWSANSDWDFIGYNVYRDTTGLGNYIKINTGLITDTQFFDTIYAVRGDTQFYAITTIDKFSNESDYSDSAGAGRILLNKYINSVTIGGDTRPAKPGATIEFYIDYLNDGFAPVSAIVIYDTITVSTIEYKLNSADTDGAYPYNAVISFSNNDGADWGYVPAGVNVDSAVTNVRWQLIEKIAPQISGISGRIKVSAIVK